MAKKPSEPLDSPALRRLDEFGTGARRLLERQTDGILGILNRARKEETKASELVNDSIRLWVDGFEESLELMMSPLRDSGGKDRTPASVVFVVDTVHQAEPKKRIRSPIELPANAQLTATDLRNLDGNGNDLPRSHVQVKSDRGGDTIFIELVKLKGALVPGQYSGLVYLGGPGAPGAPLVVINLFVVDADEHRSSPASGSAG